MKFRGFHCVQELLGCDKNLYVSCLAGGFKFFWIDGKKKDIFEVASYGSDKWQWSWMMGLKEVIIYETND